MMDQQTSTEGSGSPGGWKLWFRGLSNILLFVSVVASILFLAAGHIDWPAAWLLISLYTLYLLFIIIWGFRNAPDLLRERGRMATNVKTWDKYINLLYTFLILSLLVTAGLDVIRFRWSQMPLGLQIAGTLGLISAGWLIWRTIAENAFASRWARIQTDRGQVVISSGPYQYVRHPMYAAIIVLVFCLALELGSWWGLIPSGMITVLFIIRTALEDKMLQEELSGYRAYAREVRYRLIPGIW